MTLNKESPGRWLVDIKPHLNDVHQRLPIKHSLNCPSEARHSLNYAAESENNTAAQEKLPHKASRGLTQLNFLRPLGRSECL